ncbi:hypothetical protein A5645_21885 [Mycobacterium asiaticum]|uniref:helix-turn-helix transcriptional regulator n=1 Tax=Mycobacterium asiaticum TaxID=1790 RepID=UPI0007F00143|nr:LuxR family transcriptional regulator [Mycobacterium asiaticum]OBK93006.1 hypothetical protein A5645_21885 [Mycobacterium asiaticum]
MGKGTVGREAEARAVSEFLERAQTGPAGLVVQGEAGIGKTTLILEAADRAAAQGFQVLSARGSPAEVSYAYTAVADLLAGITDAPFADLPEMQRLALKRTQLGDVAGPATDERIVAAAFLSVVERISTQTPVLLAIDDTQWLDASSKAVIGFTARRLRGRVGLLVTLRTGEPLSVLEESWLQFARPEALTRLGMRPLSLGGVHAVVAARLGRTLPRPTITRIYDVSGGNPFFATELAAGAVAEPSGALVGLPDSLSALVRRRLGDADEEVGSVLLAAACTAAPTVDLLGSALDVTASRVVELLESVERLAIVAIDGNRVRFSHPLFATGVYTGAPPSRRRAMHRRLAEVVDQPEIKARHLALAAASGDAATLSALDAAAETTFARGAPAVAAELVELALKLGGDTPQRRVRAGELHFRAGSLVAARRHLQAGLDAAPAGILRCMALMWLGAVLGYDDDPVAAAQAMAEAAQEAGDNVALRLLCLLRLALTLTMIDRLDEAIERADEAVGIAKQLGVAGLHSQALSIWVAGKFLQGLGVDQEALQTALELEDPQGGATTWFRASAVQAMMNAYSGDLVRARTQMRAVQRQMLEGGTEVDVIWAAVHVAALAVWSGDYAEAAHAAQEAVERAEQLGGRLALVTAWTPQAAAAAYTGCAAEARAAAKSAIETANQIGATQLAKEPTTTMGFLEVSVGDYLAAVDVLRPLLDRFDPVRGCEIEGGGHLPDAVEAFTALGRIEDAEPLVHALETNGAIRDRPWMLAMGARGRGHIAAARGDLASAQSAIEQAMTHHERLPMPFERARTQLLLGAVQRRRRRYQAAANNLSEALKTFQDLGTPLWAARAQAELGRLDYSRGDGNELTAAEQRVAALAASGLSNKEIAAQLFISAKTVEMNLSRVYRKLGIRSRGGLSSALASIEIQGNP